MLLPLLLLGAHVALGLQQGLAGVVDWHLPMLGAPVLNPSPSSFVPSAGHGEHASLSISDRGVFALTSGNGTVAWRQTFDEVALRYHVHGDGVLLLTGALGDTARMFDLATGQLRWERQLGDKSAALGPRFDPHHPEHPFHDSTAYQAVTLDPEIDRFRGIGTDAISVPGAVLVLSQGARVTRLDEKTGHVMWSWEFPGGGSTNMLKSLMLDGNKAYITVISSSLKEPTIAHMVIDIEHMGFSDLSHVPGGLSTVDNAYLVRPRRGSKPGMRAVWVEYSQMRVAPLLEDGAVGDIKNHVAGEGRRFTKVIDVGLREHGYVLGQLMSGAVMVVEIGDAANSVAEFDKSRQTREGAPVYGGYAFDGGCAFTRLYYNAEARGERLQTIVIDTNGAVTQTEVDVPFNMAVHGIPRSAIAAPNPEDKTLLLSTSTGAIQLISPERELWTREESLTDVAGVHFVELSEPETEEALDVMVTESVIGRVARHIGELTNLPSYITRFVQRLSTTQVRTPPLSKEKLHRDQFGLQKLIVAVTRGGKVFALDSANGNVIWSTNLGYFTQVGPELDVYETFQTRLLSEAGNPQIAVLAVRTKGETEITIGYHIDAYTGEVAGDKDDYFGLPTGKELFTGKPKRAFLTPHVNCCTQNRVLGVIDPKDTLHIFPKCKKVAGWIEANSTSEFFHVVDRKLEGTTLRGYAPGKRSEFSFAVDPLWSLPFSAQEVLNVEPLTPSPTASYGRALGDKQVLYKYLNPHLAIVTSLSPIKRIGHVTVVDTITGAVVYSIDIPNVKGHEVHAAMVENWLVYTWAAEATSADVAGWRLSSVELFEKPSSPDSAGRSSLAPSTAIEPKSHTFLLTAPARSLSFTQSAYGVTIKDLLFVSDGKVHHFPRRLLDPRRPHGKPSAAEAEEGLMPYEIVLPEAPMFVVSHAYPLQGVRQLVAGSALLESTSLLLAHGLDIFASRGLQPSGSFDILGDGFSKSQLLVTLAALGGGVAAAAPAVRRKMLKQKWFA